jgi:hypothetical protein
VGWWGVPHTASRAPGRAASCCTSVFSRPSCSADADCKSTKAKSTRCRTDWRIASSPVVHTIVAQCSSCAARTHSCARRAEVDTTRHVCNAAGARHLAGARASGDTRIAGELICKSLMKYGPSKLHSRHCTITASPSADPLAALNQSPALHTSNHAPRHAQTIIDR